MTKATESALGALHAAVAEALTEVIENGVTLVDKEGNEVKSPASPAYLGAAIAFLKNNNITADPDTNAGLSTLREKLAQRRSRLSSKELQDAADEFAASNGSFMQ